MMKLNNPKDVLFILVSYLPVPSKIGEMKTKPTQHAVQLLNGAGIQPDLILCRAERPLDEPRKRKISTFCNVSQKDVISAPDADSVYQVPINFEREELSRQILGKFNLRSRRKNMNDWKRFAKKIEGLKDEVKIGIIGKYFTTGDFVLTDAYISVIESVKHAAWFHGKKPNLVWLNSEEYEKDPEKLRELGKLDGIIIPGGFGTRGVEGKIAAIKYAREHQIPYFGLCYGMQLAVVEFARHVCGLKDANTTEIDPETRNPVIHIMSEQADILKDNRYGGTMRLGAYPCVLTPKTISREAYGKKDISERHRHRYEFNNDFRERLAEEGLILAGQSPDNRLVEIIELARKANARQHHPFFVGVQFHPEFKTRPLKPHPLFREFVAACIKK